MLNLLLSFLLQIYSVSVSNGYSQTRQNFMIDSSNVRSLGRYTYDGALSSFIISDTIEYVCSGAGLYILNISNPALPLKLNEIQTFDIIFNYSYDSCFLLTAMNKGGVVLYNISDPVNPILVSQYITPDLALGVHFVNRTAFVAAYTSGLRIIDYSNPFVPVEIGNFMSGNIDAMDVCVQGNYAYLANGIYGFKIINIANPSTPWEVSSYLPSQISRARDIYIKDDTFAFVTWGEVTGTWSGVTIFNVANPAQMLLLNSISAIYPMEVDIQNKNIYIAADKVKIVNISDPSNPILLSELNIRGRFLSLSSSLLCLSIAFFL